MADQPNRQWWGYTDSNAITWNKMGKIDTGCNAIDGNVPALAGQPDYPRSSRRRQPRRAIFEDPVTHRTASCIIYTAAAFDSLTGTSTLAVHVPGNTAPVTYNLVQKVPDKAPVRSTSTNLPDHA